MSVVVALKALSFWLAILVGVSTIWTGLPVPFLERFTLAHVMVFGLLVVFVANAMAGWHNPVVWRGSALAMAAVFVLIIVRIVVGRPGSARVGASGGLGEALLFATAGPAFWVGAVCARSVRDWRASCRLLAMVAFGGWAVETAVLYAAPPVSGAIHASSYFLFLVPVWLLCGVLVAWRVAWAGGHPDSGTEVHRPGSLLSELGALFVPLGLAVTSPHRSRPVFALALVFSVAWVFKRFRRTALLVIPPLVVALLLITWKGGDILPQGTRRALSIFVSASADQLPRNVEVGWQSEFRTTMYRLAWARMRENLFVGTGFAFKSRDLEALFPWTGMDATGTDLERLAMAGGYHNAVVELAVTCGIPLALLFLGSLLLLAGRFAMALRRRPPSWEKIFGASLLAYWVTVTGQMLMNGGGQQFFVVCLLAGAMWGVALGLGNGPETASPATGAAGGKHGRTESGT
jgi:hypothetical protein